MKIQSQPEVGRLIRKKG